VGTLHSDSAGTALLAAKAHRPSYIKVGNYSNNGVKKWCSFHNSTSHNTMECQGKQNKDARDEGLGGQARVVMTSSEATLLDLNSNGSVYNANTTTCTVAGHYLIDLGASHHIVEMHIYCLSCTLLGLCAPLLGMIIRFPSLPKERSNWVLSPSRMPCVSLVLTAT
jgi:hypothetical protein